MTAKITVSLPDEQVEALRKAVRAGQARSVSAMVSQALTAQADRETLGQLLAHLDDLHGPVPDEDQSWARAALRDA